MSKITRFGNFPMCHWFIRDDGGWFLRLSLSRFACIFANGLGMSGLNTQDIVGYYHDSFTNKSFGLILYHPGRDYEERHFLGTIEPSIKFELWFEGLAK